MERLSLTEGPGNKREPYSNIVARKCVSAEKDVKL
jgi:hypothetical protein